MPLRPSTSLVGQPESPAGCAAACSPRSPGWSVAACRVHVRRHPAGVEVVAEEQRALELPVRPLVDDHARACEAADARGPDGLPAAAIAAIPDLHWLMNRVPARLIGDPAVLDRPTTVTL